MGNGTMYAFDDFTVVDAEPLIQDHIVFDTSSLTQCQIKKYFPFVSATREIVLDPSAELCVATSGDYVF